VRTIDVLRRMFRVGLVVDARRSKNFVRTDRDLPRGVMVFRSLDGEVRIEESAPTPVDLVERLTRAAHPGGR
jgi:hypothetical protein